MDSFYDGDLKDIWDSDLDPVSELNTQKTEENTLAKLCCKEWERELERTTSSIVYNTHPSPWTDFIRFSYECYKVERTNT